MHDVLRECVLAAHPTDDPCDVGAAAERDRLFDRAMGKERSFPLLCLVHFTWCFSPSQSSFSLSVWALSGSNLSRELRGREGIRASGMGNAWEILYIE